MKIFIRPRTTACFTHWPKNNSQVVNYCRFPQTPLSSLPWHLPDLLLAHLFLTQECVYPTDPNTQRSSWWASLLGCFCAPHSYARAFLDFHQGASQVTFPKRREVHWPKKQYKETGARHYSRLLPCINSLVLSNRFPLQVFLLQNTQKAGRTS